MSTGARLAFGEALEIAERLVRDLAPAVERVKVAGSLRRRKSTVGDIELVVEPRTLPGLFPGIPGDPDLERVRQIARTWSEGGELLLAGDRQIAVMLPQGVKAEIYLVHPPAEWGSILAIRTGPAELGRRVMQQLQRRGYEHVGGHVEREGTIVPTPDEESFFSLAGLPCLAPARRHTLVT